MPPPAPRRFAAPLLAAVVLAAADQWTKSWIARTFDLFEARALLDDILHIVHVRNTGVAFGMLSNLDHHWVNPVLIGLTIVAVFGVLGYIYVQPQRGPAPLGLGLILGGALGNLIDRARLGYVIDFIDLHWRSRHWPAFNVADVGITVGVFLLILDLIIWSKEDEHAPDTSPDRKP